MVRSSATAEDSEDWSFVGVHESLLSVRDQASFERAAAHRPATIRSSASGQSDDARRDALLWQSSPSDRRIPSAQRQRRIARFARLLDEATYLQHGETLVAIMTLPAKAPLVGTAPAIFPETGGPLNHCPIVAREYGIPAVAGAAGATSTIRTEQVIEVDGDQGIVTLEEISSGRFGNRWDAFQITDTRPTGQSTPANRVTNS